VSANATDGSMWQAWVACGGGAWEFILSLLHGVCHTWTKCFVPRFSTGIGTSGIS
jgi:hypothetical protein